jgi:hypothetical protein
MRVHLCRSTFIIFFVSQILFVWLITSVSYCHLDLVVAFLINFVCRLGYSFYFYLEHFVCRLGLLRSFSHNFVCCLSLLDHGHSFDAIIIIIIITILFYYFPFVLVHHIISSA